MLTPSDKAIVAAIAKLPAERRLLILASAAWEFLLEADIEQMEGMNTVRGMQVCFAAAIGGQAQRLYDAADALTTSQALNEGVKVTTVEGEGASSARAAARAVTDGFMNR